jgi:cold shock CspA family protein
VYGCLASGEEPVHDINSFAHGNPPGPDQRREVTDCADVGDVPEQNEPAVALQDADTQESIFVHINAVDGPVQEQTKVTYLREHGPKGANAVNVKIQKT